MAVPGVISIKEFTYRGEAEEWSNSYHFLGDPPSDDAGWASLCDELATLEKGPLPTTVNITRYVCYDNLDGSHASVFTYDLATHAGVVPGTYSPSAHSATECPGSDAMLARWPTGRRTSKGKPIYLFKYLHGACVLAGAPDTLETNQHTALANFASDIRAATGDWPGLAGPDGVAPTGWLAHTFVDNRQLRKGRRRPT